LRCLFGIFVFAVAIEISASAQTLAPTSLEKDFFKNILEDQKAIWTAPLHIERADTKWIVPGGIGLMALITTDRITGDEMAEFDRQVGTSRAISHIGSIYGLGAVAGTFYLFGRKNNDARARETGLLSAEALVNSFLVSSAIKGITQRVRPATGHSTQVWAVATVIASEYHDRRSVQIAAFATASAVSVARFAQHKHYLSDVLAGSALGYGIGKYVYHKRHRDALDSSVSNLWWPTISPEVKRRTRQYGIGLTWSF
jgi:hypothetical protein